MKNERIKVIMKLKQKSKSIRNPSKYGRLYREYRTWKVVTICRSSRMYNNILTYHRAIKMSTVFCRFFWMS